MTATKPRAKEMCEIKDMIRAFRDNREYADTLAKRIADSYKAKLDELNPDSWYDRKIIEQIERDRGMDIYRMYESQGMDVTIHIIYTDGSQCIVSGNEIVSGEITPKMQHIAYACYADAYTEYDTFTGSLDDRFGDLSTDEAMTARDEYFSQVEREFGTEWGKNHPESK